MDHAATYALPWDICSPGDEPVRNIFEEPARQGQQMSQALGYLSPMSTSLA
jgi:hypothetical protein